MMVNNNYYIWYLLGVVHAYGGGCTLRYAMVPRAHVCESCQVRKYYISNPIVIVFWDDIHTLACNWLSSNVGPLVVTAQQYRGD